MNNLISLYKKCKNCFSSTHLFFENCKKINKFFYENSEALTKLAYARGKLECENILKRNKNNYTILRLG